MGMDSDWASLAPLVWSSHRGGQNESFCFGVSRGTTFFDLDLISAYTTVLSEVTSPDYSKARRVPVTYFHEYANVADNGGGYLICDVTFDFASTTKYPNLPVILDDTSTCFPITWRTCVPPAEVKVAMNRGRQKSVISRSIYTIYGNCRCRTRYYSSYLSLQGDNKGSSSKAKPSR